MFRFTFVFLAAFLLLSNSRFAPATDPGDPPPGTSYLEAYPQRPGDAATGYQYLIYGDYISSGIPLKVFRSTARKSNLDLGRSGDNRGIPFLFNVVQAPNGVKVVTPTCLTCHAATLDGQVVVGLGNNQADFSGKKSGIPTANFIIKTLYGKKSEEWAAFHPASRAFGAIHPYIRTAVRGVNPADKIFASLAAFRNPADMRWLDKAQFDIPKAVIPTDVPPWWLMKKKHALYYNGIGRGDFGRLSTAACMLTTLDSSEARRFDRHISDVMAWIRTIEPPKFPFPTDAALAAQGKTLFEAKCSKCHGTYGENSSYPNLLVRLDVVKTDSLLASTYTRYPEYHNWYNSSWFGNNDSVYARLVPNRGYVAPPLDGIWASAPYLHNASVPTLEDLLNSPQRPRYWKRRFGNRLSDYDPVKTGWRYEAPDKKKDRETYDTTLPGYGNGGHLFGDKLSGEERKALLEYLKTL